MMSDVTKIADSSMLILASDPRAVSSPVLVAKVSLLQKKNVVQPVTLSKAVRWLI